MIVKEEFKKFLIKKLIEDISFDATKGIFIAGALDSGNRQLLREVYETGTGANYTLTKEEIDSLIGELQNQGIKLQENKRSEQYINVEELPVETSIHIEYEEDGRRHYEEFLKIDKNDFLLVNHSRESLRCGDIFGASGEWKVGQPAVLKFKNQLEEKYRTENLTHIEVRSGNEIYNILSNK